MAYPRHPHTFRFSAQTNEFLEHLTCRTGLDKTAMLERLVRAEAVVASKTDAALSFALAKLPCDYPKKPKKRLPGRRLKAVPQPAQDTQPPPPPSALRSAGISV